MTDIILWYDCYWWEEYVLWISLFQHARNSYGIQWNWRCIIIMRWSKHCACRDSCSLTLFACHIYTLWLPCRFFSVFGFCTFWIMTLILLIKCYWNKFHPDVFHDYDAELKLFHNSLSFSCTMCILIALPTADHLSSNNDFEQQFNNLTVFIMNFIALLVAHAMWNLVMRMC